MLPFSNWGVNNVGWFYFVPMNGGGGGGGGGSGVGFTRDDIVQPADSPNVVLPTLLIDDYALFAIAVDGSMQPSSVFVKGDIHTLASQVGNVPAGTALTVFRFSGSFQREDFTQPADSLLVVLPTLTISDYAKIAVFLQGDAQPPTKFVKTNTSTLTSQAGNVIAGTKITVFRFD